MRKLSLIILFIFVTNSALAFGLLPRDGKGAQIQGCAFDGTLTQILTVSSKIFDMTENLCWNILSPVACKMRLLPTSSKGSYPAVSIQQDISKSTVTSRSTPFVNISGCTGAELQIQNKEVPQ